MTNSTKLKFYFLHNKPINSQAPHHHCKDLAITVVVTQDELYSIHLLHSMWHKDNIWQQ